MPIRAGSDIAFLGGLIRHIIETGSYFKGYVVNYTNAATIINEGFRDTGDLGGYFSGFDPETGPYDRDSWRYEGEAGAAMAGGPEHSTQAFGDRTGAGMETEGLPAQRPDAAAPALRLLDPASPLRALHAGDGRAHLRHPTGAVPQGRRHADRELGPRAHDDADLTTSAGPSTRRACRRSARERSSSCCWATSAGPAEGSWPCADTPRSALEVLDRLAHLERVADHGPGPTTAIPAHVPDLQAALADADRSVVPRGILGLRRRSGRRRPAGRRAAARALTAATAVFGTYLGSYTGVLLASTAVPAWHQSRRFLAPIFVCTASASGAAATRLALTAVGGARETRAGLAALETAAMSAELLLSEANEHRLGAARRALEHGRPGRPLKAARALTAGGLALRLLGRRAGPVGAHLPSVIFLAAALA